MRFCTLVLVAALGALGAECSYAGGLNRMCTGPGGGTGHQGIGGTGAPLANADTQASTVVAMGDRQGIAGTGVKDSTSQGGIGGTGHQGIGGTGRDSTPTEAVASSGYIGNAVELAGTVFARDRQGQNLVIAKGDQLCDGDVMATGQSGALKVNLADGGELSLRQNASIQFQLAAAAPSADSAPAPLDVIALGYGSISVVSHHSAASARAEALLIQSGDATIRPIGTAFEVTRLLEPMASYEAGTYAAVSDGKVEVQNGKGKVELNAGEAGFSAVDGQAPIVLPRLFEMCR